MQGLGFLIRLILAIAIFIFLVVIWGWGPLTTPEEPLRVTVASVFLGTTVPTGTVRTLLVFNRILLGLALTCYVFIPGLRAFFDFEAEQYANTIALVLIGASIAAFFGALVIHYLYYI